jgi:hypothetical protein
MNSQVTTFIKSLKDSNLTRQQIKTLRGQALSGDVDGAIKGLEKILKRKE